MLALSDLRLNDFTKIYYQINSVLSSQFYQFTAVISGIPPSKINVLVQIVRRSSKCQGVQGDVQLTLLRGRQRQGKIFHINLSIYFSKIFQNNFLIFLQDVPAWNTIDYKKVDTVAADRRFSPDAESKYKSNFETREIGPLSKNGLFIAIQVF